MIMNNKIEIDYDDNEIEIKVQVDVKGDEWDWDYLPDNGEFRINFYKKSVKDE